MKPARIVLGAVLAVSPVLACSVTAIELGGSVVDDSGTPVLDASVLIEAAAMDATVVDAAPKHDAAPTHDAAPLPPDDAAVLCSPRLLAAPSNACTADVALFASAGPACDGGPPLVSFVADEACDAGVSRSALYTCCAEPVGCAGGGTQGNGQGICSSLDQLFSAATAGCAEVQQDVSTFVTFGCDAAAGTAQGMTFTCCP